MEPHCQPIPILLLNNAINVMTSFKMESLLVARALAQTHACRHGGTGQPRGTVCTVRLGHWGLGRSGRGGPSRARMEDLY